MSRNFLPLLLCLGLLTGVSNVANAKLYRAGKAVVQFNAKGPAGMNIVGTTYDLELKDDGRTVTITVPLKDLKTGIDLRDRHLHEKYLEVDRFPKAVLKVDRAALKAPSSGSEISAEVTGSLTLHGKTNKTQVKYKATRVGELYTATGYLHINITDYNIAIPSFLGVTVKPEVDISVSFEAKDG
jgi:polyisoprenoid-binding protein YceI